MKERIVNWIEVYGPNILAALLILVVGWIVARTIRSLIKKIMLKAKVEPTLVSFSTSLVYAGLMVFIVIGAVGKLGVPTASFVAVIGAAGLAIGFALQGALSNFAAGVLLTIFRPFKVGDFIEAAGIGGVVEDIEIFTTTLKTADNKVLIVPNGKLMGDTITNYTRRDTRRVDIVAGVSYSDDLDKVRSVLLDIIAKDERIMQDPAPMVVVAQLNDSSVDFSVRAWVKTADYWNVFFAMNESIKKQFDAEGISIPFPQRDVHIYNEKG